MCNLQTFVRVACQARLEVTLKVRGAILVRIDDLTAQGAVLGRYNLDEVLEHVLRLRRLIPPCVSASKHSRRTETDAPSPYAHLADSGIYPGAPASLCSLVPWTRPPRHLR